MENITIKEENAVSVVAVNRPQSLNALNRAVLEELLHYLENAAPARGTRALVLTGTGEKAFIAGADIKEMASLSHTEMLAFCQLGQRVANALENAPFVTIAAVNGYALGGGLEMALACDFIYASQKAKMGLPEITLGIIPGFGGTQRLSRAIGTRQAKELILTGSIITAETAERLGIVNRVLPPDQLIAASISTAEKAASFSFTASSQAKAAVNHGYALSMPEALELEKNMCAVCFATPEREQEMEDFIAKRGRHA